MVTRNSGRPVGRPSIYTDELAESFLEFIADGEFLEDVCAKSGMPGLRTVRQWIADRADFSTACARAREASAHVCERNVANLATGVVIGTVDPKAASVAIAANQWLAEVRHAAVYGKRRAIDVTNRIESMSDEELNAEITRITASLGYVPAMSVGDCVVLDQVAVAKPSAYDD